MKHAPDRAVPFSTPARACTRHNLPQHHAKAVHVSLYGVAALGSPAPGISTMEPLEESCWQCLASWLLAWDMSNLR